MSKYGIILYWSEEDQAFIAEVPELPGCAADGPTRQEALTNAEMVIEEWIETATGLGRPIPCPQRAASVRLTARPRPGASTSPRLRAPGFFI
jgi:predicted RNase H-like HicB family nuclease